MDSHLLFELTYVFYKIRSASIHGECRRVESSREFCIFYPPCEGWLRNLTQCLLHNISSHSFVRRTFVFSSVRVLSIIGEGFAWWSSLPLSVNSVFFIIGRDIRVGRELLLLCSMELLLQIINLSLHGFIIISPMGDVASPLKMVSTCMGGMYTAFLLVFPISFMFKIEEIILVMNIRRFHLMRTCLMWTWSCHIRPLYFTNAQVLHIDDANCRVTIFWLKLK